jgi:hypothetical protein
MNDLLSYFTLRIVFIFASTTFSILVVMLALNIITVDETVKILNMSPEAANAFKLVISNFLAGLALILISTKLLLMFIKILVVVQILAAPRQAR